MPRPLRANIKPFTKHAAAAEHTPQPDGTKGAHRIRDCIRIQDRVASTRGMMVLADQRPRALVSATGS